MGKVRAHHLAKMMRTTCSPQWSTLFCGSYPLVPALLMNLTNWDWRYDTSLSTGECPTLNNAAGIMHQWTIKKHKTLLSKPAWHLLRMILGGLSHPSICRPIELGANDGEEVNIAEQPASQLTTVLHPNPVASARADFEVRFCDQPTLRRDIAAVATR